MNNRLLAFSLRARPCTRFSRRSFLQSTRHYAADSSIGKKAIPKAKDPVQRKQYAYPEHLLIWNAGAAKQALVGTFKVMTVIVFGVSCVFLAPRFVFIEGEESWKALPAIILGACPMLFTAITAAPFVASIRIRIPAAVRSSREALLRFASNPPPQTLMEISTIRLIGLSKRTTLPLSELRPIRGKFRVANMERIIPEAVKEQRSLWVRLTYWMKEPRNRFYVGGEEGVRRSGAPKVWPAIWASMQKTATRS